MTRWARFKNKQEHDASSWQDLKKAKQHNRGKNNKGGKEEEIPEWLEKRRAARRERRKRGKPCFHCREPGHMAAKCPKKGEGESAQDICFKCGSTEHSIYQCKKDTGDDMPFATCFICKQKGHLSSKCPDNPRGLYPDGGGCRFCGSVEHYRRDCPERNPNKNNGERKQTFKMRTQAKEESIEAIDNSSDDESDHHEAPKPKKAKVVKF